VTPAHSRRIACFSLLACLVLPACESGWDIDGRVITSDVTDKSRSLHIFVATAERLTVDRILRADPDYAIFGIATEPRIPDEEAPFEMGDFGCHRGEVAIVAWAPGIDLPADTFTFEPRSGDLVAVSRIASPYCGMMTNVEHYELRLGNGELP
jgi:hypothetical protein